MAGKTLIGIYPFIMAARKVEKPGPAARRSRVVVRIRRLYGFPKTPGISVPPYHPMELDAALRTLARMSPEDRRAMGERGRAFVLQHHEWSVLGRRYGKLCEQLAASSRRTEAAG